MKIHNRLKHITLVAILLLLILSGYFFITSYISFEKARTLKKVLTNNATLSSILTQVDKERGLTSLYLGSKREDFADSLKKQRDDTDASLNTINRHLVIDNNIYLPYLLDIAGEQATVNTIKYKQFFQKIKTLPLIRKEADSENTDFQKIFFDGYSNKIVTPILDNLLQINNLMITPEISSLIHTLSKFYIAKENAGLERGLVAYYTSQEKPMSLDELILWHKFKTNADILNMKNIGNMSLNQQLNKIFSNPKDKQLLDTLSKTSLSIIRDINGKSSDTKALDWFSLQTQKISMLSKAELIISNRLWQSSDTYMHKQLLLLSLACAILLLSFILLYLGYSTSRDSTSKTYKDLDKTSTTKENIINQTKKKKILIAKKLLLERKILVQVIKNLGYAYDVLENIDDFRQEVISGKYDIIFTDVSLLSEETQPLYEEMTIITDTMTKKEIQLSISKKRDS